MAWQDVETDVGSKVGRCSWSVSLKHGGARISVPEVVVKALGWTAADRFKLQVGSAESEGALRLVLDAAGKITGKRPPKGGGLLIRLGRFPGLAPRDVDKVAVDHQQEGKALVVRLPRHAQSVAPPPPAAPSRASSAIMTGPPPSRPVAARVEVTDRFTNDPKPKAPPAMAAGTRTGRR